MSSCPNLPSEIDPAPIEIINNVFSGRRNPEVKISPDHASREALVDKMKAVLSVGTPSDVKEFPGRSPGHTSLIFHYLAGGRRFGFAILHDGRLLEAGNAVWDVPAEAGMALVTAASELAPLPSAPPEGFDLAMLGLSPTSPLKLNK
mmetsp:Transcript_30831/g.100535  ORF Transcript_30831/g.100535 Transcript_30831/m.100535 type:complete len:147 (+) Transcript_30831:11-451(+)